MSTRKTRIDKGIPRRFPPSPYDTWRETFMGFDAELQDRGIADCELIQRVQRYKPRADEEAVEHRAEEGKS